MKTKYQKAAREQLDEILSRFQRDVPAPRKGWIRAIRDALGLSGRQLAHRIGVNQKRVARIEHDEVEGKVTLYTMQRAAEAMDCQFVYTIVPNDSLEQIIKRQAQKLAKKRMEQSSQTMRLEQQELSDQQKQKMLEELTREIIETIPRSLWDEV